MLFMIIVILFSGCGEPVVVEIKPSKPQLDSPLDSQNPSNLRLNWSVALNADRYDVYLGKTINSMNLIAQNVAGTYYDVTDLDYSSLYYWRVIAKNQAGTTPSDIGIFSIIAQRTGNYIEIQDVSTLSEFPFSIRLSGNLSNIRALEIILQFDPEEILLAPLNSVDEISLLGNLADAFGLFDFEQNTLTIALSKETNFSLNQEDFLEITCDAEIFTGVSQIAISVNSQVIDENFNSVSFNKTDIGYVFIR